LSLRTNYSRGCVIKLQSVIRARCLLLRPDIIAERVTREARSTRSAYLVVCALFLRNRAPAVTATNALS
jgi:hypothetical protein